ncbi:MAG: hypothetical protein A2521_16035 [Deltaproteobacteria bacterium RIFOXYD12_FULL_57_12]|nr:MAG: hypothetical protein A2521_16035 [Deltaproteobacteria bacterium RIFOXYD12_FULL_57_12]
MKKMKKKLKSPVVPAREPAAMLCEYAGDFFSRGRTIEERRQLLKIAVLGWNLALFPVSETAKRIQAMTDSLSGQNPDQGNVEKNLASFRHDLVMLAEKKRRLFPRVTDYVAKASIELINSSEQVVVTVGRLKDRKP